MDCIFSRDRRQRAFTTITPLPAQGVQGGTPNSALPSADGYGAKGFSMKELETAINLGAALEETLVRPWGTCARRSPWPQICAFLSN